jgi:exodeoxyribonuclease V gamma subunit
VGKVGYDALCALADDSQQVDARLYPRVLNERAITIHKCTGIQRETEVVCNTIWDLLMHDSQLKLTDIAVVIASQMDAYAASLEASFKHRGTYIDYKFAGYRAVAESPVIAAIRALLDLPESDFKRSDVLNVLLHPNVRTRCQNANPSAWIKWCDETNIRHGISRESHLDTYIKDDVLNWDQGLFRLALGTVLDQPLHTSPEHIPVVGQNIAEVAAFHSFARSLLNDARWLADANMPLTEWMTCIADLIDIYVGVDFRQDGPDKEDLVALAAVRRTLVELGEQATSDRHVSYRTASRLIQSQLESLIFQSDQIFVDGVTVGSPTALQGIPFKHVFMLGMNEGDFPASDLDNPLDLRTAQTHLGDVKPNTRDRYAFFQILSSVEKSLHISYVARDPFAGSETDPSSVVSELLSWLREEGFDTNSLTRKHPLRRYQESGYSNFLYEAHDEAIHHQHGRQLRRHFAEANLPLPHQEILRNYATEFPNILKLRFPEISAKNYRENTKNIQVKLGSITRFLKSPLNGMAGHHIGFLNDDEDFTERDQENFGDALYGMTVKLRNAFWDAMRTGSPGDALEEVIDSHFGRGAELKGDMPTGIFHGYSVNDIRNILGVWAGHWGKKCDPFKPILMRYAIGVEPEMDALPLESLKITVKNPRHLVLGGPDEVQVEIVGVTCPIVILGALVDRKPTKKAPDPPPREASYFLQFTTGTNRDASQALEGYCNWLVLQALGNGPGNAEGVLVSNGKKAPEKFETDRYAFTPVTQGEARQTLQSILSDLLFPTQAFVLPGSLVASREKDPNASLFELIQNANESDRSTYDLLSDTERYMLPADPDEKIARYFSGFTFSKDIPKSQEAK